MPYISPTYCFTGSFEVQIEGYNNCREFRTRIPQRENPHVSPTSPMLGRARNIIEREYTSQAYTPETKDAIRDPTPNKTLHINPGSVENTHTHTKGVILFNFTETAVRRRSCKCVTLDRAINKAMMLNHRGKKVTSVAPGDVHSPPVFSLSLDFPAFLFAPPIPSETAVEQLGFVPLPSRSFAHRLVHFRRMEQPNQELLELERYRPYTTLRYLFRVF